MNPDLLTRLERLHVAARVPRGATGPGRRLIARSGRSQEFLDYRHYAPGDDLRYVDWNIYARHDALFIKEFAAEERLHVAIAVDTSSSMSIGTPSKLEAARELAVALAWISLAGSDAVSLFGFADVLVPGPAFVCGKSRIGEVADAVESLRPAGRTDLKRSFSIPLPPLRGKTAVILLSDFFDERGVRPAVESLRAQRMDVHLVQLLAPEDVEVREGEAVILQDAETGRKREVRLSTERVRRYRERLRDFLEALERFARQSEIPYVRALSSDGLESILVAAMRAGVLERRA